MKALGFVMLLVGAVALLLLGIGLATLSRALSGSPQESLVFLLLSWAGAALCGWGAWQMLKRS